MSELNESHDRMLESYSNELDRLLAQSDPKASRSDPPACQRALLYAVACELGWLTRRLEEKIGGAASDDDPLEILHRYGYSPIFLPHDVFMWGPPGNGVIAFPKDVFLALCALGREAYDDG